MLLLEHSIQNGNTVLLENIGEEIDPIFEDILQNKKVLQGTQLKLKMGERLIDFNEDFRFFITTKQPNPHYSPEICVKV